jgi:hypothetical protein
MTSSLPYPPPFQDIATLAKHLCTGESTIENWVKLGAVPPARKIMGKRLWVWTEVVKHIAGDTAGMAPSLEELAQRIRDGTRREAAESH